MPIRFTPTPTRASSAQTGCIGERHGCSRPCADLPFPHSLPEFKADFSPMMRPAPPTWRKPAEETALPARLRQEPFHFENRPGVLRCRGKCRQNSRADGGNSDASVVHTPLNVWFWAAYQWSSSADRQRHRTPCSFSGNFKRLSRYETAQILHKLRSRHGAAPIVSLFEGADRARSLSRERMELENELSEIARKLDDRDLRTTLAYPVYTHTH